MTQAQNKNEIHTSDTEVLVPETPMDVKATIAELATLSPIEYDIKRKEASKNLGVQVKTLDAEVKAVRTDVPETGSMMIRKVEPYQDPVVPEELLDEILATLRSHVVMDADQACAVTLWIALTWFMDVVQVAPLLIINAPEKACGKSQALDLVARMSANPLVASNITPAALFRSCELWNPTLLIDEADTFIRENNEIKGLINAGHTRISAYVVRTVGENHEPKQFNIWGAKAMAGIGLERHLPDSTMSRGIIINMRRKMPSESVTRIRHATPGLFDTIGSKLARFAIDYKEQVRVARPVLPEDLSDRAQDNWEPLLAIAECAGPKWVVRATVAAAMQSSASESHVSTGNELLADIQYIFESKGVSKITTVDLITALVDDDEKPWATYNRGKQISPRQIASQLSKYGIKSKTVRFNNSTPKGFDTTQFEDAFARYLGTPSNLPQQSNDSQEAMPDEACDVSDKTQQSRNDDETLEVLTKQLSGPVAAGHGGHAEDRF